MLNIKKLQNWHFFGVFLPMLTTFIKIAWRNLSKNRWYSFVNISGLAVALTSFIIILVYFNYEMSFDKWDVSLERVYKVSLRQDQDILSTTPAPLADLLAQRYSGAEAATRIQPAGDYAVLLTAGDKKIYQKGLITVDSTFLKVFPYQLVQGDAATALNAPNAAIISEEVSEKLFGKTSPIGKTVKVNNFLEGVVTGVLRTPAGPSHLDARLLIRTPYEKQNKHWQNYSYQTYIKTRQPVAKAQLEAVINEIYYNDQLKKNNRTLEQYRKAGNQTGLFTDAVADLHNFPQHGQSHFKVTLILLILAVFLLLAGAINFSNLSLARAITRAKEVGIRKVLGSRKINIVLQSLAEIAIQCLISLVFAGLLVSVLLPWFGRSFNLPLSLFGGGNAVSIFLQITGCLLLIVLISGLYPALFLSNFQTAEVLKGKYSKGTSGVFFRNSLLVVQLTLSALFITGILVINRQMQFMQEKNLGFNASRVIRIEATQKSRDADFEQIRRTLLSIPGVGSVSKSTSVAGSQRIDTSTNTFQYEGQKVRLNNVKVSPDYFVTMGIKLVEGRYFDYSHPEDMDNTAIINESAAKKMGAVSPSGRFIRFPMCDTLPYTIVGVVKDFNIQGLESAVEPTVYSISNAHCGFRSGGAILVSINTDHLQSTVAGIEKTWKTIEPDFPVRYSFLDADFQQLFASYQRLEKIILFFSVLSILITVMGLFALTSFLARQRIKEIGIRKVLGASVASITGLLSEDFAKLSLLSIVLAMPIAWWALSKWLEDFAYKIDLTWGIFALSAFITIGITLLTVCCQAIKAALSNPTVNLRTE
ncbi:MAG TPA: ABC transporter permease [Puia sp.]